MTKNITSKKRKRKKKFGYNKSFNPNIIAWILLILLGLIVLVIRTYNW